LVLEADLLPAESASKISQRIGKDSTTKDSIASSIVGSIIDSILKTNHQRPDHQKMDQTLRQLGELLLGAVPTVILLAMLYILYTFLVHRPLTAVLAERHNRTQGAMEKARADIATAEARTAEYEQRLREARQRVFKNQEARRRQATQARNQAVNEARIRAHAQVKQARADIEQYEQQAMSKLQSDAAQLATDIVRAVLRPVASPSPVGGK
jgi:F-type H+-transporting ATPase subunit b